MAAELDVIFGQLKGVLIHVSVVYLSYLTCKFFHRLFVVHVTFDFVISASDYEALGIDYVFTLAFTE